MVFVVTPCSGELTNKVWMDRLCGKICYGLFGVHGFTSGVALTVN
jgi:hypothetical protein